VLVKADLSQVELRAVAQIAPEPRMIAAFERGEDLHTLTARAVRGTTDVTKQDRQAAKAINFGLVYGMGAERLR
jgi:DNA polymerase-1